MKGKFFITILTLLVGVLFCFGLIACDDNQEEIVKPKKLGNVTVVLEDDIASWDAVKNASRYAYQINEEEVVETTLRYVVLEDGDSIKVKAVGDGLMYTDGNYSKKITYTAPPAPIPPETVKLDEVLQRERRGY